MRIAAVDLVSTTCFPALAAEELGFYQAEGLDARSYLTVGRRLADFPAALDELLQDTRFRLHTSPVVPDDLILKVHTQELIEEVDQDPL